MKVAVKIRIGIYSLLAILCVIGLGGAVVVYSNHTIERQISLGDKYLTELDYEKAIVTYHNVIKVDSKNVDAYIGLTEAYIHTENYSEAVNIVEKALNTLELTEDTRKYFEDMNDLLNNLLGNTMGVIEYQKIEKEVYYVLDKLTPLGIKSLEHFDTINTLGIDYLIEVSFYNLINKRGWNRAISLQDLQEELHDIFDLDLNIQDNKYKGDYANGMIIWNEKQRQFIPSQSMHSSKFYGIVNTIQKVNNVYEATVGLIFPDPFTGTIFDIDGKNIGNINLNEYQNELDVQQLMSLNYDVDIMTELPRYLIRFSYNEEDVLIPTSCARLN